MSGNFTSKIPLLEHHPYLCNIASYVQNISSYKCISSWSALSTLSFHIQSAFPSCILMRLKCSICKWLHLCCTALAKPFYCLWRDSCAQKGAENIWKVVAWLYTLMKKIPEINTAAIIAACAHHWGSQHQYAGHGFEDCEEDGNLPRTAVDFQGFSTHSGPQKALRANFGLIIKTDLMLSLPFLPTDFKTIDWVNMAHLLDTHS